MSKEAEEYILAECKKILEDVTGAEFYSLMQVVDAHCIKKIVLR